MMNFSNPNRVYPLYFYASKTGIIFTIFTLLVFITFLTGAVVLTIAGLNFFLSKEISSGISIALIGVGIFSGFMAYIFYGSFKRARLNREMRDRFIAITNEGLVYQDIDISDNLRKYEISYQDIIWVDFVHEYESEDFYRVRYKSGEKVENLNIDFYFTDDHSWVEILREEIIRRNKIVSIRIEVMNVKDINDFKRRIKNKMEELSIYGVIENTSERVAYIIAEGNEELLNRFIIWCKEQFGEESILISYERVSGFGAIEIR